jgi:hypothetical protein
MRAPSGVVTDAKAVFQADERLFEPVTERIIG